MSAYHRGSGRLRLLARFSAIEFLFYAFGSLLSYQTVFLRDVVGLGSAQIGVLTAVCAIVSLAVIPLWGMLSDRLYSARAVFGLCIAGASCSCLALSFLDSRFAGAPWLAYPLLIFKYIFHQPSNSLMDGWAIGELSPLGIGYGAVRVWGSVGFALFNVLLGLTVGRVLSLPAAFRLCSGLGLVLAVLSFTSRGGGASGVSRAPAPGGIPILLRNVRFMTYLLFCIAPNIFVGVTIVYFPYILEAAQVSSDMAGIFTGFRSVFEIASMLLLVTALRKKVALPYIVALPGLFGAAEHLLYGFRSGAIPLLVSMAFSGLAGGVFYSMGPSYIHSLVPERLQNTAQSMAAMVTTFTAVLGSYLGGVLIQRFGVLTLTRGCGVLMATLSAAFLLSHVLTRTPFFLKRGESPENA